MCKRKQYKFCQRPDFFTSGSELPGVSLRDRALSVPPSLRFGATPGAVPSPPLGIPSPPCRVAIADAGGLRAAAVGADAHGVVRAGAEKGKGRVGIRDGR